MKVFPFWNAGVQSRTLPASGRPASLRDSATSASERTPSKRSAALLRLSLPASPSLMMTEPVCASMLVPIIFAS